MTTTLARFASIGFLVLLLAGCAQVTLVRPGKVTVGNTFQIQPTIDWSRRADGKREHWTVDGLGLNHVLFLTGIGNGEPIMTDDTSNKQLPAYRTGMTAIEISEAIQASLAASGTTSFKIQNLRPQKLGGVDGFRFEFSFTTKGGLEKLGLAAGAVRKEKLNVIFYLAPRIHYFEKYRAEVETIFGSVKFI